MVLAVGMFDGDGGPSVGEFHSVDGSAAERGSVGEGGGGRVRLVLNF